MKNLDGIIEGLFDIFNLSQEERDEILKEAEEIVSATTDKEIVEKVINACEDEELLRDIVNDLVEENKAVLQETPTGWSITVDEYVIMLKPRTVKEFPIVFSVGLEVQVWHRGKQLSIGVR